MVVHYYSVSAVCDLSNEFDTVFIFVFFFSGLIKIKPGNDIFFSLFVSIYDICIWIWTKITANVVVRLIESFYSLQTSSLCLFINTFCDVYKLDCNEWKLSVFIDIVFLSTTRYIRTTSSVPRMSCYQSQCLPSVYVISC